MAISAPTLILVNEKNTCTTSNNLRLESAFDVPGQSQSQAFSLCDVIGPCEKICGGCHDKSHKVSTQIRIRKRSSYVEHNDTETSSNTE